MNKLVSYWLIGGSSGNDALRTVGFGIPANGWPYFIETRIRPQIDAGCRRFHLHNPAGLTKGQWPMDADGFIESQYQSRTNAALRNLMAGPFLDAWGPVMPHIDELVCYIGDAQEDEDFRKLKAAGDSHGWQWRMLEALRPMLDLGPKCSIAFDRGGAWPAHDPVYYTGRKQQSLGRRILIEPRPHYNATHLHDLDIISTDPFWIRSDPDLYPQDSGLWAAGNDQLTGKITRILQHAEHVTRERVNAIWADGHTACVPGWNPLFAQLLREDVADAT